MRVIREDAHFTARTQNICQVMHVVGIENAVFLCNFFGCDGQKRRQVNLFIAAFKETLIENELVQIDVLEHMVNPIV